MQCEAHHACAPPIPGRSETQGNHSPDHPHRRWWPAPQTGGAGGSGTTGWGGRQTANGGLAGEGGSAGGQLRTQGSAKRCTWMQTMQLGAAQVQGGKPRRRECSRRDSRPSGAHLRAVGRIANGNGAADLACVHRALQTKGQSGSSTTWQQQQQTAHQKEGGPSHASQRKPSVSGTSLG